LAARFKKLNQFLIPPQIYVNIEQKPNYSYTEKVIYMLTTS